MIKDSCVNIDTLSLLEAKGLDIDINNSTYGDVLKVLREESHVHPNIVPTLERDGTVKYYLKSIIIGRVTLNYKKKKFDTYEDCVNFALTMLGM